MKRKEHWETELSIFIQGRLLTPLVWGKTDCFLTMADAVLTITDVDIASSFRGEYGSIKGAYEIIGDYGGLIELMDSVADRHGLPEINKNFAQRGDVVVVMTETAIGGIRQAVGFIEGLGQVAIAGKDEMRFLPIEKGVKAWKI